MKQHHRALRTRRTDHTEAQIHAGMICQATVQFKNRNAGRGETAAAS